MPLKKFHLNFLTAYCLPIRSISNYNKFCMKLKAKDAYNINAHCQTF